MKSITNLQTGTPLGPAYNQDGTFYKTSIGGFEITNPLLLSFNPSTEKTADRMMFNNYIKIKVLESLFVTSRYAMSSSMNNSYFRLNNAASFALSYGDVRDRFFENSINFSKSKGKYKLHLAGSYIKQTHEMNTAYVAGNEEVVTDYIEELKRVGMGESEKYPGPVTGVNHIYRESGSMKYESAGLQTGLDIRTNMLLNVNFRRDFFKKAARVPSRDSFGAGMTWVLTDKMKGSKEKLSSLKLHLDAGQLSQFNSLLSYFEDKKQYRKSNRKNVSVGGELGLLSDRIHVGVDLFNQVSRHVPAVYKIFIPGQGVLQSFSTVDKMISQGVDINISTSFFNFHSVKWTVNGNASLVTNSLIKPGYLYGIGGDFERERTPVGSWFLYQNNGVWNSDQEIQNEYKGVAANRPALGSLRYVVDERGYPSQKFSGSANPNLLWGLSSDIFWNKFDCSVLLRGEAGQKIMNSMDYYLSTGSGFNNISREAQANMWSPSNPAGNFPGYLNSTYGTSSDWFLQKGSFIRLQSLSFGYTQPLFKQKQNVRFYLSGQNLFLITKYQGWDPEVNSNGQDAFLRGTDTGVYPRARTFTVGMQVHL